jgi:hypothetical protein
MVYNCVCTSFKNVNPKQKCAHVNYTQGQTIFKVFKQFNFFHNHLKKMLTVNKIFRDQTNFNPRNETANLLASRVTDSRYFDGIRNGCRL